jgi:hypothetical protein
MFREGSVSQLLSLYLYIAPETNRNTSHTYAILPSRVFGDNGQHV